MTMIIDGSTGLEFPDGSDQTTAVPAPGTSGNILQSNGTIWTSAANPPPFSSGTLMLFQQTSAPTGWTKQTTHNDKALRVVSGSASTGGSVGFTTAFASQAVSGSIANTTAGGSISVDTSGLSAGATTLSTSQIPSHTHSIVGSNSGGTSNGGYFQERTTYERVYATGAQGGGGSHSHSISGSATSTFTGTAHNHTFTGTAINLAVSYVDLIIASKD